MDKLKNGHFVSPSYGKLTISKMIERISEFIEMDPYSFYRLIIGTDSQARRINSHSEINYVTAIVIYREGKGGRYFWKKDKKPKIPVLRDKIYTETTISLQIAEKIVPKIRQKISPSKYDLEIHIDVGALGPTRNMIKEVVGMVNGNGFTAKTKPESWGASAVADKHT
ncbi:ribonuclease H-like YkuK family protein [Candidatus Woesebacteria bacterium]|nr:ribonuclease H-like YkuK family protein [Candidatus Woesebacteria bacterium]